MDINNYIKNIFHIKSIDEFNSYALQLFHYQYKHNTIYNKYISLLNYDISNIKNYLDIPFLPIEFFKTQTVISTQKEPKYFFISSGTTNHVKSKHFIADLEIYKKSLISCFNFFIGNPQDFVIFCLVPQFDKHPNSSLAFMCNELINCSTQQKSGFYLDDKKKLKQNIIDCEKKKQKYILLGLSFEIMNFAKKNPMTLNEGIIIETGGTKKNQVNMVREELHEKIKSQLITDKLFSEYGMAELLSQSYFLDNNYFKSPPWKKIIIRDKTNPLRILNDNKRGCINIIDLANIHSCGFIATNDLGHKVNDGFNVTGRNQNATERGCNLMT